MNLNLCFIYSIPNFKDVKEEILAKLVDVIDEVSLYKYSINKNKYQTIYQLFYNSVHI
jgi:hypothetical protein